MSLAGARLLEIIGDLYDAATDRSSVSEIGAAVRRAMGVESGIMFICEQGTGRMLHLVSASANFDAKARAEYAAYYHPMNEWFSRAFWRQPPFYRAR